MPSFDFRCDVCGYTREEFYHDPRLAPHDLGDCPRCYANTAATEVPHLLRQIGAGAGAIFRGPGFYVNDYRKPRPLSELRVA